MVKIIECPRDAMQGIKPFIDTKTKAHYINNLLQLGFDTIDFGSFVSPRAIPQMKDTAEVLSMLDLDSTLSSLLAIVANVRGARQAVQFEEIEYLGYPFSISETFQLRNTNATIEESLTRLRDIQTVCQQYNKKLVVYLSMGFGNPYGDPWNVEIVQQWVDLLADFGVKIMSLSDTIGAANRESISYLFGNLIPPYPDVEFGAHFHTTPDTWFEKVDAAFKNGCMRFDGAIRGLGGCPMAKDKLTGNMPTEKLLDYFKQENVAHHVDHARLPSVLEMVPNVFPL